MKLTGLDACILEPSYRIQAHFSLRYDDQQKCESHVFAYTKGDRYAVSLSREGRTVKAGFRFGPSFCLEAKRDNLDKKRVTIRMRLSIQVKL